MTQDDIDFGFTAVDEEDLRGLSGTSTQTEEMTSQLETTGETVKLLEYKMDNLADRLGSMLDEVSTVKEYYENEKVIVTNKLQEV